MIKVSVRDAMSLWFDERVLVLKKKPEIQRRELERGAKCIYTFFDQSRVAFKRVRRLEWSRCVASHATWTSLILDLYAENMVGISYRGISPGKELGAECKLMCIFVLFS